MLDREEFSGDIAGISQELTSMSSDSYVGTCTMRNTSPVVVQSRRNIAESVPSFNDRKPSIRVHRNALHPTHVYHESTVLSAEAVGDVAVLLYEFNDYE
jgi:hypothetical protein